MLITGDLPTKNALYNLKDCPVRSYKILPDHGMISYVRSFGGMHMYLTSSTICHSLVMELVPCTSSQSVLKSCKILQDLSQIF